MAVPRQIDLVLDRLHPHAVAVGPVALLQGADAANVQPAVSRTATSASDTRSSCVRKLTTPIREVSSFERILICPTIRTSSLVDR